MNKKRWELVKIIDLLLKGRLSSPTLMAMTHKLKVHTLHRMIKELSNERQRDHHSRNSQIDSAEIF